MFLVKIRMDFKIKNIVSYFDPTYMFGAHSAKVGLVFKKLDKLSVDMTYFRKNH